MKKGRVVVACVVLALFSACGTKEPPGDDPTQPPATPAAQGSIAPVEVIPGLSEIGLEKATLSVESLPGAWAETAQGITTVTDADGADVQITQYSLDGAQRWRHTVAKPQADDELSPRLSVDETLGVVALWFSKDTDSQNAAISGDIRWFDLQDGQGDTIRPQRSDESSKVESWQSLVGYISYTSGFGPSTSFTYLGPDREPHTVSWSEVLKEGEESWLASVEGGIPSYAITDNNDAVNLRYGDTVVLPGLSNATGWVATPGGLHASNQVPGSKLVVVDGEGSVVLDYAGDCDANGAIGGHDGVVWAGRVIFDSSTGEAECLEGFDSFNVKVLGLTSSGIALAFVDDETMAFSEPSYKTVQSSKVPVPLRSRGGYLIAIDDRNPSRSVISVFNGEDLSVS